MADLDFLDYLAFQPFDNVLDGGYFRNLSTKCLVHQSQRCSGSV